MRTFGLVLALWLPLQANAKPGQVVFDHTFNHALNDDFKKSIERGGFQLSSTTREHPSGILCHFIFVGKQPEGLQPRYLEFCKIVDKESFLKTQKADPKFKIENLAKREGMKGLSLSYTENLAEYLEQQKAASGKLIHRNFDWKANSKERMPGWDFVMFERTPFPDDLFVWFTNRDRATDTWDKEHANGARKITGTIIEFADKKEKTYLEKITFRKFKHGRLVLDDGFAVIDAANLNGKTLGKPGWSTKAVLVEADGEKLDQLEIPYEKNFFEGQKYKIIPLADAQWDIWLLRK